MTRRFGRPVSRRRQRRQGGMEILEFGIVGLLLVPMLLGMVSVGMGLVESIEVNTLARDLDNIYIHGGDFSSPAYQALAGRLATGLGFQYPAFGSATNIQSNTGTTGNGIIWVTQVMYVGPTTGLNCQAVGAANCTNHDAFVYTQQMVFGNSNLTTQHDTTVGNALSNGATITAAGIVSNPVTDSKAALPAANDSAIDGLFQTTANGQTPLADGQVIYIVEAYFQTPNLSFGNGNTGVYARYFF